MGRLAPANFCAWRTSKTGGTQHAECAHAGVAASWVNYGALTKTFIEAHDPRLVRHEGNRAWSWIEVPGHDPAIVLSHAVDGRSHAPLGHH